jgi:dTDP-4-dehydrorhamnose reductase
MNRILVTGGKGQLGSSIRSVFTANNELSVVYVDVDELDITNRNQVLSFFDGGKFTHCINCAAYTAVDLAEEEKELANAVNNLAVKFLSEACKINCIKLIHVSTDFVFEGKQPYLYNEESKTNPINTYGLTKLEGEKVIQETLNDYVIIRTSWLYSEFSNNFVKTMLRLGTEKSQINVISDQIGTPTYAKDLAEVILKFVLDSQIKSGLYHFSNEGVASWYDFAYAVMDYAFKSCKVIPIKAINYPTSAARPNFSVMDKSKIKNELNIEINHWTQSLKECLNNISH